LSIIKQDSDSAIGVVHFGLGPIGRLVAELVGERATLRACAAIDVDPTIRGQTLDQILMKSGHSNSPRVVSQLSDAEIGDSLVAVHCTGSSLQDVLPQLLDLVDAGLNVVSTCEQLSFPWRSGRAYAEELDRRAKQRGVSILGTGVNPGFAMDYLPIVLSGVLKRVNRVRVVRVQNAATRRSPLQVKIGAGASIDEFRTKVSRHELGHIGLRQSADGLAEAFGWSLDQYTEIIHPVVASKLTPSGMGDIPAGRAVGLHQVALGVTGGQPVIELDLTLAVGVTNAYDEITLYGDTVLKTRIPGGVHGDAATAALVVNSIPRITQAAPGLMTMADLAPPHPGVNYQL
jgi:2,4-diaminopentanoate dehydrogenase